jgi:hypothetical protein
MPANKSKKPQWIDKEWDCAIVLPDDGIFVSVDPYIYKGDSDDPWMVQCGKNIGDIKDFPTKGKARLFVEKTIRKELKSLVKAMGGKVVW